MKIVITGNMGYIGPWVIRQLRSAYPDACLVGVDMGYFAHCLTAARTLPETGLDIQHIADVRNLSDDILAGADAVVHLAAISNDPMGNAYEQVTLGVNHRASLRLAGMAKAAGVRRFVFASSCSIYGFAEGGARDEQSPLNPLTAYAKSKVLTESSLKELSDEKFNVTCLRFSTACGMSDRLRLDLVLNDFVAAAVAEKRITILSDGTPWRPLIDVKDMARAIEWALGRNSSQGGNYLAVNVGSDGWNYQVKDLAEAVAQIIPGTVVSINKDAQPDKRSYKVDFALYRKLAPLHQPEVGLAQAIAELREGLESMGFKDGNFRNSSFMRLKVLTHLQETGLLTKDLAWSFRQGVGSHHV